MSDIIFSAIRTGTRSTGSLFYDFICAIFSRYVVSSSFKASIYATLNQLEGLNYHLVLVFFKQLSASLLCVHRTAHVLVLEVKCADLVRGSDEQVFLHSIFALSALNE